MRYGLFRLPAPIRPGIVPPGVVPAFALALAVSVAGPSAPGFAQPAPASDQASNIGAADTGTDVAPSLPSPDLGAAADPQAYLRAARVALATGHTGEAQEAMEMAETRLLDRSTPLFRTDQPDDDPLVAQIRQALQALGNGNPSGAIQVLDGAIPLAARTR